MIKSFLLTLFIFAVIAAFFAAVSLFIYIAVYIQENFKGPIGVIIITIALFIVMWVFLYLTTGGM